MGIKQRGNVKWCSFMVGGVTFQESCGTNNLREAKEVRRKRQAEERAKLAEAKKNPIAQVGSLTVDDVTFDLAFARYLSDIAKQRKDCDAIIGRLGRLSGYLPEIGLSMHSPLSDFTDDHMTKMRAWRLSHYAGQFKKDPPKVKRPVTNRTVNQTVTELMRDVFNHAKRVLLKRMRHPFPNEPEWSDYLLPVDKERVRFLSIDEQNSLIEEMGIDFERMRRFMILTGLRLGNCLLKWSEVNFELRIMSVIGKGGKRLYKPMSSVVEKLLRECQGDHPEFVFTFMAEFTTEQGGGRIAGHRYPITYAGFQSHWREARKRAAERVPSLIQHGSKALTMRLHDHRHTFGTNFQKVNGDIRLTQGAMGHASVTQTQMYAHIVGDHMIDALNAAEQKHYLPGVSTSQPMLPPPKKDEDAA